MRIKFYLICFLLLFARGCDFYSTGLWFFDHPEGETNPLVSVFHLGWNGLLISNIILVSFIIYCFYYYTFKYKRLKPSNKPTRMSDYISELYFNEKGKLYQILFKTPKNRKTAIAHFGYIVIRVAIIGSFLATIHNICQYYNVSFYNNFREIVGRPLYVIYVIIFGSFIYYTYRLWLKEYSLAKNNTTN